MLTALWPRLAGWHPTYRKEDHVSNSHLDSLLNLMPPIGCFVPLSTGRLVRKPFYPFYRGCPAVSGSALPDHAKHTSGDRLMSINTLRERPIPPHPKGWGLLGQLVEDPRQQHQDPAVPEAQAGCNVPGSVPSGVRFQPVYHVPLTDLDRLFHLR